MAFFNLVGKLWNRSGEKRDKPVTVTQCINDKVALDISVKDPNLTVFGEKVVGIRSHDISVAFNYNISTRDVTVTDTGGGTSEYDQNTLKLTPGTGVGKASAQSKNTVTYRPGTEAFGMFTIAFEGGGEEGLSQEIGIMDSANGFFVGFNGEQFSVALRKDSVTTWIPEYSFNGEDISWLAKTKLNIYMIRYGWLGIAPISYYVYFGPEQRWVRMHSIDLTNKQTLPHINTPILPICILSERTAGTGTSKIMRTGSWRGGVVSGEVEPGHRQFAFANSKAGITTTRTNIFTLSNKSTYQGVTNRTPILLELISVASDGAKPVEITVVENTTLGGTPSFADIDENNSVIEVDTAGTTLTGGDLKFASSLGKSDSEVIPLVVYKYHLHPGDTMTFAARATSTTTDITFAVNWGEIF